MRKRQKARTPCEICGASNKKVIDFHHIIPRTDPKCTEAMHNLAILCANCHRRVHSNEIIIEGVFMTTSGEQLFWRQADQAPIIRTGIILRKDGTAEIME